VKVSVDKNKCIGCGNCVVVAAEFFGLEPDGKSKVIKQPQTPAEQELVRKAFKFCPTRAIIIEK